MGISIAYRGRLADLTRIEDFEDRLLDLALEVGGQAKIWRSHADSDPARVVRGIILDLAPGQESTGLLVSPEGWIIGLADIEDAELGRLTEPPWCFTKTQFGPLEAHVALVEVLEALRREFVPDLEIADDGGYYPTRDLAELTRRHSLIQEAMKGLAEGLQRHGLSHEAAEGPDILLHRIERIAAQVHRILQRPAEHPPVALPDDEASTEPTSPEAAEAQGNELFKHDRRQEWFRRALQERQSRGEFDGKALDEVVEELGYKAAAEEGPPGSADDPGCEEQGPFARAPDETEPWEAGGGDGDEELPLFEEAEEKRHPLVEAAFDLLKDLYRLFAAATPQLAASVHTLLQAADDVLDGLAAALPEAFGGGADKYGLHVTQLKRALRGAAFASGALFPLRSTITAEQFEELQRRLKHLQQGIFEELGRLRSERREDNG